MQAKDFFTPQLIGEFVHPITKYPNGVHIYGLVIDPAGIMVAGVFGARASRIDRFKPEIHLGIPQSTKINNAYVDFRFSSAGAYDVFDYDHPEGFGTLVMYVDKTAMLTHQTEEIGENIRFFTIGAVETDTPFLDMWSRRLQNLMSVAILPEWQQILWDEMAKEAWIAPCDNYGGFGPVWDTYVGNKDAMAKLLHLIQTKAIQ